MALLVGTANSEIAIVGAANYDISIDKSRQPRYCS
jgi:hypothetical protein